MSGPYWASLRSDHPADHYVRQALDEQERNDYARDDRVDDHADADVA